jgi:uncharacterized membrane protein
MTIDTLNLIVGLFSFFMGNISGYVLHDRLKKTLNMSENSSKNFLLVIVTLVWSLSMIVDVFNPDYEVPIAVHGILGAIVGFFFYRPKNG